MNSRDQDVGAERLRRGRRISVPEGDHRNARRPRRRDVRLAVAHHHRFSGADAHQGERGMEEIGRGLAGRAEIAADDTSTIAQEIEALQNLARDRRRLVGADAERHTRPIEPVHRLQSPRIGPCLARRPRLVEREISGDLRLPPCLVQRQAMGREAAFDEHRHALSDHPSHRPVGMAVEPAHRHQVVERAGDVGQAVDQRAVEIEHHAARKSRPAHIAMLPALAAFSAAILAR